MTTPQPTAEQMAEAQTYIDREAPTPIHWQTTREWMVRKVATLISDLDRLAKELEAAKKRERVLWAEIEIRRDYPAIRGSGYFPKCPEHAAGPCDCPQCKWADACRAARNATDALKEKP